MAYDLSRFVSAHRSDYSRALSEIRSGRKMTHWMWYIFPQIKGLGYSRTSQFYAVSDIGEAKAFLQDAYLGANLREITAALLTLETCNATAVMGRPDDVKLRSCMTLFTIAAPEETLFRKVLDKYFGGQFDYRTVDILRETPQDRDDAKERTYWVNDDNIAAIREAHPEGLRFVVGDTHCEEATLRALLKKIAFDPEKDHVYFVGDYNGDDNPTRLLNTIAKYYEPDWSKPGFHLIRGNHERYLHPYFRLENLPDIVVLRGGVLNYYIVHAGMMTECFDMINRDMAAQPGRRIFAYSLDDSVAGEDAPFNQVIWSKNGLYKGQSLNRLWPKEDALNAEHACIIHGHTPFVFMKKYGRFTYGSKSLYFSNQHAWFSEDLHAFNIDSNIKGRYDPDDPYRGLTCLCLEVCEEIAAANGGCLTAEALRAGQNALFGVPLVRDSNLPVETDLPKLLSATPEMKTIRLGEDGKPVFE